MFVHFVHLWQMLLATVADEIANLICFVLLMADVIAICLVADVKPLTEHNLADVIVKWQMLKPLKGGCVVADVIDSGRWKNHRVNYFSFSSEVLNRTSSQTCGRWYLPTFLLRDGSLTLMYRASFIVLLWFKSFLPTMLKLLMVTL